MAYDKPVSPSGLKLFKQCRRRWHNTYVLGNREPAGRAAERGTRLHELLENFFRGAPYPASDKTLAPWRRFMEALTIHNPTPEADLAVDKDWKPVAFDDESAFFRGKADLTIVAGGALRILDWKSGRVYDEHEQQADAYVAMAPQHTAASAEFVYLDAPLTVKSWTYTPDRRDDIIASIITDVTTVRECEDFYPSPGKGCDWCLLSWRKGGDCRAAP